VFALPPTDNERRLAMTAAADDIVTAYRRFAEREARGRSPRYERLAHGVAGDSDVIAFLLSLPPEKRQPNLLLAAARHLFGVPADIAELRRHVVEAGDALRALMLARSTQTNEPARCAVLLPVLARLPQPLALLEVGAAAGLCLLPDYYAYDYGTTIVRARTTGCGTPVFPCALNAPKVIPAASPQIVWRAGLDLHPMDLSDPAETAWLETLVWPEQTARLDRLRLAIAIAATQRPRIKAGDLRRDLASLAGEMPRAATRVIFHTAVLNYVADPSERAEFASSVGALCDVWIANEAPGVFPEIAKHAAARGPAGCFLLAVDGAPVAWTDPHGASLSWISAS
jgi:hypothetical protein